MLQEDKVYLYLAKNNSLFWLPKFSWLVLGNMHASFYNLLSFFGFLKKIKCKRHPIQVNKLVITFIKSTEEDFLIFALVFSTDLMFLSLVFVILWGFLYILSARKSVMDMCAMMQWKLEQWIGYCIKGPLQKLNGFLEVAIKPHQSYPMVYAFTATILKFQSFKLEIILTYFYVETKKIIHPKVPTHTLLEKEAYQ